MQLEQELAMGSIDEIRARNVLEKVAGWALLPQLIHRRLNFPCSSLPATSMPNPAAH